MSDVFVDCRLNWMRENVIAWSVSGQTHRHQSLRYIETIFLWLTFTSNAVSHQEKKKKRLERFGAGAQ